MYSKEQISEQLRAMNAPRDSVVTVHSSLRAAGEIEGRGEGLLDALIEYFTAEGGLLVIPTHTWDNFCNSRPITLDMNDNHTCIGTLPDLAAARKDAHRSLHPTHSVTVFGDSKKAEEYIREDRFAGTCTPPEGCYGKIYKNHGFVLLLGVGHEKNTYLHCVEEMLDVKNRNSDKFSPVVIKQKDGTFINREIRFMDAKGIGDVSAFFPKLEPAFRYYDCITDGFVGDARAMLCDAVGMKKVMELIYGRSGKRELLSDSTPLDPSLYVK